MKILAVNHLTIKTQDLDATARFYVEILGAEQLKRPNFPVPGCWLAIGGTQIHVMAEQGALDHNQEFVPGSAAFDHMAFAASDIEDFRDQFRKYGLDWKEFEIPGANVWQLFVYDPSGVLIELAFDATLEDKDAKGPDQTRLYFPGNFPPPPLLAWEKANRPGIGKG